MKPQAQERIIRLLLRILYNPNTFNKQQLIDFYETSESTIKRDIQSLRAAGIEIIQEKRQPYRYTINPGKSFSELKYLQPLSDEDKGRISRALHDTGTSTKKVNYIIQKLESLYDFKKLGLSILSQSELDKIDTLKAAKQQKTQAILVNYRSNTSAMRNRTVEVFDIDVSLNTIQCYEPDTPKADKLQHFRIARFDRAMLTDTPWQFEPLHKPKKTDIFRIANDDQVSVHLKLKSQAYNYLVEHYPMARGKIRPASQEGIWDFEAEINRKLYGLTNFILANSDKVEIVYPIELQEHLRTVMQNFIDRME